MKMFSVGKIGIFCDAVAESTEKRRSGEVQIQVLSLRVQPFDAKLAVALAPAARHTLFTLADGDPQPHLTGRVDLGLGIPRQTLTFFASPDTRAASIAMFDVLISGIYARRQKDMNGFALVFRASVGPCGKEELEYIQSYYKGQRFVSFEPSAPNLEFADGDGEDDDDEQENDEPRPTPMFDTEPSGKPLEADAEEPVRQRLKSHAGGKGKKLKSTTGAGATKH